MARRPVRPWITPDQEARWCARLEKHDPEDALVHLLWTCLAKDILPSFRFASDPDVERPLRSIKKLAAPLAQELAAAVLTLLEDRDSARARRSSARVPGASCDSSKRC
jgi:hypothetical protein